ncbi:hypothetical protein QM787_22245 [Rhodococcus ruber]|uniref:Uncharacterized protein n=1 Tax=Rhodococcus ruber TaxID=1830 RepID=A0A098BFJ9_9NOCA|nr:hypothetical protein [Rhodococcus ruber]ETT25800.1 hypothetical protein RR21198_3545 [Rhodococcus rhodochrous ATCC 21198]MCD2129542.1 hypothetical protein [Rhodococcus ruber]MCZ4505414.1 hypothetical protein [Rhodococcus ruber]MCZ4532845.1 hypothetical protein [Rhodococcus ruber]MCZ4532888.1 hypothetical protein [Rhodococcus ruber]
MTEDAPAEDGQPLAADSIRLVGGINFTTWPDLKWSRGKSHVALLQSKFDEWHASVPVSIDAVLREDRLGVDLVARVPKGVPKHEWSLDLGDALHNLRSAFDAMAWGIAHFDNAQPARPKSVYFPICTEKKQWRKALNDWVGDIHPEFQERLRIMQPFTDMPAGGVSMLSMLHDLDIQDKHRDILTVSTDMQGVDLDGSFVYEDHDTSAVPRLDMLSDIKFGDGVVLGTIHAGAPIRMVGQMILRPAMKVRVTYRDTTYDVMPMLEQFVTETRRHLDILLSGLASPDDEEWSPMGTGPPPA